MKKTPGMLIRSLILAIYILLGCLLSGGGAIAVSAAPVTVYKGVDYARVYNYTYYVSRYPNVANAMGHDEERVLAWFVEYGMKKQHQASNEFSEKSYRYGNADLRKSYKDDYEKYYLHYINYGYLSEKRRETAVGIKTMKNPRTDYNGTDYSNEYNYYYYVRHHKEVLEEVGDDDTAVIEHYVKIGRTKGWKAINEAVSAGSDENDMLYTLISCKITGTKVQIKAKGTGTPNNTVTGLFTMPSYVNKIDGMEPIATGPSQNTFTIEVPLGKNFGSSLLFNKFTLGVQESDGSWRFASRNYFYIQNPYATAENRTPFPTASRGTKKGLKMDITAEGAVDQAVRMNLSHVVIDFPIEAFLNGTGVKFRYEGQIYEFSSTIKVYQNYLRQLYQHGILVTGVFYLADPTLTDYILPSAVEADKTGAVIYALNTANEHRKTLEALFTCLATYYARNEILVANWIYGNESNQYRQYHFCGDVDYNWYIRYFTEGFRLFNTAVKSVWRYARTYICFDHNWNLSWDLDGSYHARQMLDAFDKYLKKRGYIHYDVALHPYNSPELSPRYWEASRLVTNEDTTQQYTMRNVGVIAEYIKANYGKWIHIILSETGVNSQYNGMDAEAQQAASIAYAYYKTEFDSNLDMIAIHRDLDQAGEMAGGFYLGVFRDSYANPKEAVDVLTYMDTEDWNAHTSKYLRYIGGVDSWLSVVRGFNPAKFEGK